MALLSDSDLDALNEARTILARASVEAVRDSYMAQREVGAEPRPASLVRFAEAADAAENAIFHALNIMDSYHVQALSEAQLHNRVVDEGTDPDPHSRKVARLVL